MIQIDNSEQAAAALIAVANADWLFEREWLLHDLALLAYDHGSAIKPALARLGELLIEASK